MSTQPVPTPGLVAYEPNPTVTNVGSGSVQKLNSAEYATIAAAFFVVGWLTNDPRTSAWGPFTVASVNQSNPWWKYSVPLRQIQIGCGAQFDAALCYKAITSPNAVDQENMIAEMGAYASGQNMETETK